MFQPSTPPSRARLRFLLPREHGGWAFLLLPLTAGLLVRPSWTGAWVAGGALAIFLARGPLQAGRRGFPMVMVLGGLSFALFGLGVWQGGWVTLGALLGAALLGLPLLGRSTREMRNLNSESLALMACAGLLPAVLGAGGATWSEALRGWLLMVLLALPPLVHLRHRLAQGRKGEAPKPSRSALVIQLLASLTALGLWQFSLASGLLPLWTFLLLFRGFQTSPTSPQRLGWTEAVVSLGHLGVLWITLSGL